MFSIALEMGIALASTNANVALVIMDLHATRLHANHLVIAQVECV